MFAVEARSWIGTLGVLNVPLCAVVVGDEHCPARVEASSQGSRLRSKGHGQAPDLTATEARLAVANIKKQSKPQRSCRGCGDGASRGSGASRWWCGLGSKRRCRDLAVFSIARVARNSAKIRNFPSSAYVITWYARGGMGRCTAAVQIAYLHPRVMTKRSQRVILLYGSARNGSVYIKTEI
jgi:hypothetical protein